MEKYGVKWMSIGYFARPEQALVWRGPLASNALKQMILQVAWGELDYLLIDLPPGTGDIQISLVNDVPLDGVFVVTTPQSVALDDVEKSIDMFRNPKVDKHIFGIIENMAWFTPEEYPDHKYYIFGRGGAQKLAAKYNLPLLAQIPLVASISSDGDAGTPAALHDGPVYEVSEDRHEFAVVPLLEILPGKVVVLRLRSIGAEHVAQHILLAGELVNIFIEPDCPVAGSGYLVALEVQEFV